MGRLKVVTVSIAQLLQLAGALGGAGDGYGRAAQEMPEVMREGIREGLAWKDGHSQVIEEVPDVPLGTWGPLTPDNTERGACSHSVLPQRCMSFCRRLTLGDIGGSLKNEVHLAGGGVY